MRHRLGLCLTAVSLGVLIWWSESDSPAPAQAAQAAKPHRVECLRATGKITLDGVADEAAWKNAPVLDSFADHWSGQPKTTPTRARVLWDDEYLYFYAEMDDVDLYADITEPDGMTWLNDVFELFFKPHEDQTGYYELQVNPANTRMDMYIPSRGSGGFQRWIKDREFKWTTAVKLRGTIDTWEDTDEGWSTEGRIPWTDFAPTGGAPKPGAIWKFTLCRYDYSVTFDKPQLSALARLKAADYHRYEDYSELLFVK